MFNCFKKLNKRFICSICSTCLLCAIGISRLGAIEDPLYLGDNTVAVAEVGKNVFLTNSLKDNIYSSNLLPIFSEAPILYVDENGNASLSIEDMSSQEYRQIPYGEGTSITVYLAAVPYSEDSSSVDELDWYVLDPSSWNNLCVRDPGKYSFFYHVESTDNNIKGTIENTSSFSPKSADTMVDMISGNFIYGLRTSGGEILPELNQNTGLLGFKAGGKWYIITDDTSISNKKSLDDFVSEQVSNPNLESDQNVREYTPEGTRVDKNTTLSIEPDLFSCLNLLKKLSINNNNETLQNQINNLMDRYHITSGNPNGVSPSAMA